MLHSLNFDKLPIIRFGRAFFSLDNELSQELRRLPRVFNRAQNSIRFLHWSMQDAKFLHCPEEAVSHLRDGCVRAALTEIVSIEEMQAHDFKDVGASVRPLKLNDGSNPAWHLLRELRNLQTHLRQDQMTAASKDVLWGHHDRPEEARPLTISVWSLQGVDAGAFNLLRNAKKYSAADILRMVEWFNSAQGEWGVQDVLACITEDYCRALLSREA